MRRIGFWLGALAWLTVSAAATANGRFPRGQRLVEDPQNPQHLMLYATYGILNTVDGGQTWDHLCEAATGTYNGENALFDFMKDGTILVGVDVKLIASADQGCDWGDVLVPRDQAVPADFSIDPADRSKAMAIVNIQQMDFTYQKELHESTDNGKTWSVVSTDIPEDFLFTLDFAPSEPQRFYVSAWRQVEVTDGDGGVRKQAFPVFLRNDTRGLGTTWTSTLIGGYATEQPFIARVLPDDANKIFVRTDYMAEEDRKSLPLDGLFYSTDGGGTWKEVLRHRAKLFGFALSPDGTTVVAGYGNIRWPSAIEDETAFGLYRAKVADLDKPDAFTRIFAGPVSCVTWTAGGLYVCSSQTDSGFEVARADNADFTIDDTSALKPILTLPKVGCGGNVRGPLACPDTTEVGLCDTEVDAGWHAICPLIGTSCDGGTPDCGVTGGAGGTGGTGGTSGTGGASGSSSGGSAGDGTGGSDAGTGAAGAGGDGAKGGTTGVGGAGASAGNTNGVGGNQSPGPDGSGGGDCAIATPRPLRLSTLMLGMLLAWASKRRLARRRRN